MTAQAQKTIWEQNSSYKNFKVTKVKEIKELQCRLIELRHNTTNAHIVHLANEDPENLFAFGFQTVPYNSNGVAHILEHTVLCGSRKFPVKDPFFSMTRRSLNTFMNAFTGSDFTLYPASSQVPKDFYNLMEVYLDAVFHPNLQEMSFLQEGHRLEYSTPTDKKTPLLYQGIVFNEMKGAMTSPSSRLSEAIHAALYPDITYGFNSGGNPKDIPSLTYQELLDFHKKYYHPSRCLFFFYGDMPLEKHLDYLENHLLYEYKEELPLPKIPKQKHFTSPVRKVVTYPVTSNEEENEQTIVGMGWVTCPLFDQDTALALIILESVLMDNDAAPLKRALLDSKLCKQASSNITNDYSQVPITLTMKGCLIENVEALEEVVKKTLNTLYKEGIDPTLVESSLHQLELHHSEITGDSYPFGLSLFMRSGLVALHGGPFENGLALHEQCNRLKKTLESDPTHLEKLMKKYLIDNTHFAVVTLVPDHKKDDEESAEERKTLDALHNKMTDKERDNIVCQAAELEIFQREQEEIDINILPKVTLKDVPKESRNYILEQYQVGKMVAFHHPVFTNKIVYADLVFNLPDMTKEELSYAQLMCLMMPQMGCGGRNYKENLEYTQANTGGVSSGMSLQQKASSFSSYSPYLQINGYALERKSDKLFPLLLDMAVSTDFNDVGRIREVLEKHYNNLQMSINSRAMKYAVKLAASGLDQPSAIMNQLSGLDYLFFIKGLVESLDKDGDDIAEKLKAIQKKILCQKEPHLVVCCSQEHFDEIKGQNFYGLSEIEQRERDPWKSKISIPEKSYQGVVISSPVAFTGKVFNTTSYLDEATPALAIAANLMDNISLHTAIREKGGAYGGGSSFSPLSGHFSFYAYRDPNITATLDAFEEAVDKITSGTFSEEDIEEAKLEVIQGLDSPLSPGSRGIVAYSWMLQERPFKVRQAYRKRLLATTKSEIVAAVKKWVAPQVSKSPTVVFAGDELLEKENKRLKECGKKTLSIQKI